MQITELEKKLYPNCYELNREEEFISTTILDEELDPIKLIFNYDRCVQIETKDLEYIILSVRHLENLISLIKESENMFFQESHTKK